VKSGLADMILMAVFIVVIVILVPVIIWGLA
jgi:hypothetical protein